MNAEKVGSQAKRSGKERAEMDENWGWKREVDEKEGKCEGDVGEVGKWSERGKRSNK